MRKIIVEELKAIPVEEQKVEIVERKGLGHPDYICDSIMEEISRALSKEYMRITGSIWHFNIDKGLLVAGGVERKFGGGRVTEPMKIIIGDRATLSVDGKVIPVDEIAIETARDWIRKHLRFVDPVEHVRYQVELKPGSTELTSLFRKDRGKLHGSNDTSAAVGYAPMSPTEKLVLEIERYLNSSEFKNRFPETGEDVKVMGFREGRDVHLTIAMPFIDRFIENEAYYFERKRIVLKEIKNFIHAHGYFKNTKLYFNTLDRKGKGIEGIYLSVLGTSAEDADSGQVGRGNRVNGLIALNRPTGAEAAAGKNPVSHVGKIYNILAHQIANRIYKEVDGIREVYVWLCSQIGSPIDKPKIASAQILKKDRVSFKKISKSCERIIDEELSRIGEFCEMLLNGKFPVC
ncbi:MAG: methionine adenosyltransferase [Candidatus Aenigmatarchaeota archaeon]